MHYLDAEPTRLPEDAQSDRDAAHTERLRDTAIAIWNAQIRILLHEAANKNWHGECPIKGYDTKLLLEALDEFLVPDAETVAAQRKAGLALMGWGVAA